MKEKEKETPWSENSPYATPGEVIALEEFTKNPQIRDIGTALTPPPGWTTSNRHIRGKLDDCC